MDFISTDDAPKAIGPYSQAVLAGEFLFCSGQLGVDPATGALAGADVETQAAQALRNIAAVLEAAGLSMSDVVRTTVYLASMDDFPRVNAVYARAFDDHRPARSTVAVAGLPLGGKVEIECVAACRWARRPTPLD